MKSVLLEKVKTTEKIVRQIETDNVLVFVVDRAVTKKEIGREVERLFDVSVDRVRTYVTKNKKNAYVKLKDKYPAIDIATKLGVM